MISGSVLEMACNCCIRNWSDEKKRESSMSLLLLLFVAVTPSPKSFNDDDDDCVEMICGDENSAKSS